MLDSGSMLRYLSKMLIGASLPMRSSAGMFSRMMKSEPSSNSSAPMGILFALCSSCMACGSGCCASWGCWDSGLSVVVSQALSSGSVLRGRPRLRLGGSGVWFSAVAGVVSCGSAAVVSGASVSVLAFLRGRPRLRLGVSSASVVARVLASAVSAGAGVSGVFSSSVLASSISIS